MSGPGYRRVQDLFLRARELGSEERAEFLEEQCGADQALRSEVLGMLEFEAAAPGFLDRPAVPPETILKALQREAPAAERVAKLVDQSNTERRFLISGELGEGGMGRILEIFDTDLRRSVAMKVLRGQVGAKPSGETPGVDSTLLTRFLEEAQVTGQLEHPGVVPVYELGVDEHGRVYFTMRRVQGQDLGAVFARVHAGEPGWSLTRAVGLLQRVCETMTFAHDKGVVHRDLKPANVMVGDYGEVYVMDWGLAGVSGRPDPHDLRLPSEPAAYSARVVTDRTSPESDADSALATLDGTVIGTPHYMPPEQAHGRIEEIDHCSDVYSMGAMLYHLLAGRMPYAEAGERPQARDVLERLKAGPPSSLERTARDAPLELLAICERAMARDRAQRYGDMHALAADMTAYLEGRVVQAHKTGALVELSKWVQRNRGLALASGLLLVSVCVGLVVSLDSARKASKAAVREKARANEVLRLSALTHLGDLLLEADELWPAHPEKIAPYSDWIRRARELTEGLPDVRTKLAELAALKAQQAGLEASVDDRPGARLPEGLREVRWWSEQLTKLIGGLDELRVGLLSENPTATTEAHGWSMPRRLRFSKHLRDEYADGGQYALHWKEALPRLRAAYPGTDLVPELGLVPLGPDTESGLWEFADLTTGIPPERDETGKLVLTEESGLVFVLLPGGTFMMGAQSHDPAGPNYSPHAAAGEGPPHEVTLSAFFLSKYEMTQGQWRRFMGSDPEHQPTDPSSMYPVVQVNWFDCMEACARMGLSLPTEAQWEYGARAGTTSAWWTGDESGSLGFRRAANLADETARKSTSWEGPYEPWDDGYETRAPINSFAANSFGLHEVAGNVWEWCQDGHDGGIYARGAVEDPMVDPSGASRRVMRGGGFFNPGAKSRSAARGNYSPLFRFESVGLRPARELLVR